jgi:hypothetical protein
LILACHSQQDLKVAVVFLYSQRSGYLAENYERDDPIPPGSVCIPAAVTVSSLERYHEAKNCVVLGEGAIQFTSEQAMDE